MCTVRAAIESWNLKTGSGTFDIIWAGQMPYVHPGCAIAVKFRFEVTELGNHPMRLVIVDEDGKILASIDAAADVQFQPDCGYYGIPWVFNLQQFPLPKYGEYEGRLVVDHHEVAAATLAVPQPPNQILPA